MLGNILEVKNLHTAYVDEVLHDVNLSIGYGQRIALLGSNGSGKSTLLKAISGMLSVGSGQVTKGIISFEGHSGFNARQLVRQGLIHVLDNAPVFTSLTVAENLMLTAYQRGINRPKQWVLDLFPALVTTQKTTASQLSGGQRQMLAVARALMAEPRLLLLDEVSVGLSAAVLKHLIESLDAELPTVSIILAEQNLNFARQLTTSYVSFEAGRVTSAAEWTQHPRYLS